MRQSGGLKQAFVAYNNWIIQNDPEPKLPGLKYTTSQLFWIAAAQTYCAIISADAARTQIISGQTTNEFNVIGSISNQPDFAFDFNCRRGTKMNPKNKCEIW